MKIYNMQGFDRRANFALNEAISIGNKLRCTMITSEHMMHALLKTASIAKDFEDITGISGKSYQESFEKRMSEQAEKLGNQEQFIGELEVKDFSSDLRDILTLSIESARNENRLVTPEDIYYQILVSNSDEFWRSMPDGIKSRIALYVSDPLKSMPETAKHAVNYNKLAKSGAFDPIYGRENEINQVIEILGRRVKNNPCLIGDPGVGKTAIVEGLAQKIVAGNVPYYMKNQKIICIDISSIVSGTKFRGDFEERLNKILEEAASRNDVILFFDEMHMLMEAGSSNDSPMTAANIIKPAISKGDVKIIGATTTSEFKKFIDKDKAFERRLQRVVIDEPSVDDAYHMVETVSKKYDEFHGSITSREVIKAAVNMSDRYLADKKLPDKAITVIDETAARLKKTVIEGETFTLTVKDIKDTISKITGIDVSDIDDESRGKMKSLDTRLKAHVIGQDEAIGEICKAIKRGKAGIKDPNKPTASFLFVGPTGVGKTEVTKALSIELFGSTKDLIRFDMSEFMEKHSVSKLIGSPPGYVGYGEGGQLTEAVRKHPSSIILFDEIEKAHPDVFNIFLQVLDEGTLTDSEGNRVDFKNTVIIMTSNAGYGAHLMNKSKIGFASIAEVEKDNSSIAMEALESTFRPEFLNRVDKVVVFNKLSKEISISIAELILKTLSSRVKQSGIAMSWTDNMLKHLVDVGFSDKYGARNIKRKVQELVEDKLADMIIDGGILAGDTIIIDWDENSGVIVEKQINICKNTTECKIEQNEGCVC